MKVVIVGAGIAGVAAAFAARSAGAGVVLIEASDGLGLNQALLPDVLSGECPPENARVADASRLSAVVGVELRLNERVLSVDSRAHTVRTGSGLLHFDSLILATGSRYIADEVKGISKRGVFLMKSLADYVALSESRSSLSHVAIAGPAPLSLIIAQVMSRGPARTRVKVFLGARGLRRFSPHVEAMVARAAMGHGVELLNADIDAIVGTRHAEALISAGGVHPCEGVVLLPRCSPVLPELDCSLGDHGGVLVDHSMRTSSKDVFAAGDCAEVRLGSTSLPCRLYSSSRLMGETAGLNASGGAVRANLAGSMALDLFGVEVCTAGIDLEEGLRAGLDVARVGSDEGGGSNRGPMGDAVAGGEVHTSIVYERSTRRVHGIQVAGTDALSLSGFISLAVSTGATLEDLAYSESPYMPSFNTAKSPIALTAGKALREIQERRIEAQGTRLRHG